MIRKQKYIASLFPPFKGGAGRVLGLLLLLLSACIREDRSDCSNTFVRLEYLADGTESVLNEYIKDVDLYIFDKKGYRLKSYTMTELPDGTLKLNLQPEEYILITVANANKHTYIMESTTDKREYFYVQHPNWFSAGDVVETHDHNYIGEVKIKVVNDEFHHYDTLMFRSAHVNMDIQIEGLPAPAQGAATRASIPYTLRIEQSTARINFYNQLSAIGEEIVEPALTYDAENQCYRTTDLALFRLDQNGVVTRTSCPHQVVLLDAQGNEMTRFSLYDYLQQNADKIDVTKQEADVPIAIKFSTLGVEIVLPGWKIEDVTPDWG